MVTTVYGPVTDNIDWLEWGKSAGSTEIAFSMITEGGGFSVYTIDIASPSPTAILIEGGDTRFPSWSPDDSSIAYTVVVSKRGRIRSKTIWVEDLGTGDKTELANGWSLDWKR